MSGWHGKSGKEIFTEIQEILKRAENAATAVEAIDGTFVFGYYQVQEPGLDYFSSDKEGDFPLKHKDGVIYYDLGNLPNAYVYDGVGAYQLISIGSDIGVKVDNLEKDLNNKVEKIDNKQLSSNDYTDDEKKKIQIIDKLSDINKANYQTGQLFSTKIEETDPESKICYPSGLYLLTEHGFQRVGGLL